MHLLITGGTGLIGRHLIPRLLQLGHQVNVVTRDVAAARDKLDPRVMLWSTSRPRPGPVPKGWRRFAWRHARR